MQIAQPEIFGATAFQARLADIHAATVVPLAADYSIDEAALARHITDVCACPGIAGLLVNGHAGENFVLSPREKQRVTQIARECAPDCLIVSGVNAEGSLDAAHEAELHAEAGADGILVFPPNSWALPHDPECVILHHRIIAERSALPLMLYGAPIGAGTMAYPPKTLEILAREPSIVAIKEGSWEVAAYEENRRLLLAARPDFRILGSGDEHLMVSYLIGSHGSQVSLAAVVPEGVVALWTAASAGDWAAARIAHDRLYPLSVAIYRDSPGGRATARLKFALELMGRIPNALMRPPQPALTPKERAAVESALAVATGDTQMTDQRKP